MIKKPTIVWFRQDLRIHDNPAFIHAAEDGPIIALYIWSPEEEENWPHGGASKWWLHHSLKCLAEELRLLGIPLLVRMGNAASILEELADKTHARAIFWNRRYEPYALAQEAKIRSAFENKKLQARSYNGNLLFEPWDIANKQNKAFQTFTAFWKACLAKKGPEKPLKLPQNIISYEDKLETSCIKDLDLLPKIPWDAGIKAFWNPGSKAGESLFQKFLKKDVHNYLEKRDRPDLKNGVSHLSPYLHFGELSPRYIWHALSKEGFDAGVECFMRQLGWREFAYHMLYHFPFLPEKPIRRKFQKFPWRKNASYLRAWQKGKTGYPFIDAGMRELWSTGWMHNRVRMAVGSFLVKDLLLPWQEGEKWFWDTLVDADLANNSLGWQWVGGCGADAAPYFRIFNPVKQGEKFDPQGDYVRKWIPELKRMPDKWIHKPWQAPQDVLLKACLALGTDYPFPIVDHDEARNEALSIFKEL